MGSFWPRRRSIRFNERAGAGYKVMPRTVPNPVGNVQIPTPFRVLATPGVGLRKLFQERGKHWNRF